MAMTDTALCRVTIVAPHTRMDVALPAHVPLVELQSELLVHAASGPDGEYFVDDGVAAGGWALARLGEPPLDPDLSCSQLGIIDGEELFFRPVEDSAPGIIFDDVVDAVSVAGIRRSGVWNSAASRKFGMGAAGIALGGAVLVAAVVGSVLAGTLVLVAGVIALTGAWALERAFERTRPATMLGVLGVACGLSGGIILLAQERGITDLGAPQYLAGGSVMAAYALLASLAVERAMPLFHSVVLAGVGMVIGTGLCTWLPIAPPAAAASLAALFLVVIPALPMISYRLAQLPIPDVPSSPEELRQEQPVPDDATSDLALARSDRADEYLTGLLAACSAIVGGCVIVLGMTVEGQVLPSLIMAGLFSVWLMLKSRYFRSVGQRLPLLIGGFLGPAALAYTGATSLGPDMQMLIVAGGLTALTVLLLLHALAVSGRKISPVWGRVGDIFQMLLGVAVVPMTLWVWGAYWWIRTI
ncbi:MAG: type VII secretion integral membrane protein EccD [Stackebrandtia sp.]